jgi:hypothetical protein
MAAAAAVAAGIELACWHASDYGPLPISVRSLCVPKKAFGDRSAQGRLQNDDGSGQTLPMPQERLWLARYTAAGSFLRCF